MTKKIAALLLCGALLLTGTGCQLARPETAGAGQPDRLIGVYITWEYVDTFDLEGYLSDHIGTLSGGDLVLDGEDVNAYSGHIPAQRTEDGDWDFPGLEGLGFFCPVSEEDGAIYIGNHIDPGICSNKLHHISTDEGDRMEMDCTVYVAARDRTLYCNPVYQTADGQVYLTGGGGMSSEGDHDEGELFSTTLSSESASTLGGERSAAGSSVTVHMEVMFAPEEIVLIQMDGDSRELSRASYEPGRLPERLTLDKGCAYVLAETRKRSPEGEPSVARELVTLREDGPTLFTSYYAQSGGLCFQQSTELIPA